jgi:crotonobetainyl-CoA:carnitine CoA-transferase CaiB-like acyl-CoA transferase
VDDPDLGPLRMNNVLFRMSDTPGRIRFPGRSEVGADTDEVLAEVGVDPDVIRSLRDRKVIR